MKRVKKAELFDEYSTHYRTSANCGAKGSNKKKTFAICYDNKRNFRNAEWTYIYLYINHLHGCWSVKNFAKELIKKHHNLCEELSSRSSVFNIKNADKTKNKSFQTPFKTRIFSIIPCAEKHRILQKRQCYIENAII